MRFLLFGLASVCVAASAVAAPASKSLPSDPKPVRVVPIKVASSPQPLKVIRTASGDLLRGPTLWQWKSCPENDSREDRNRILGNRSHYQEFRSGGYTALRLASFEPWFQSDRQPYAEWSWSNLANPAETQRMLQTLELAINAAGHEGMYVVLNCHSKFNAYDHNYALAFWEAVAPYFANRTHVLYELANEIRTGPADYTDDDIRRHVQLSNRVRVLAPKTFQIVLTPSGTWAPSNPDGTGLDPASMERLADRFDQAWKDERGTCDWAKTAVGYHLYFNGKTSDILARMHHRFPGLPTEVSYPYGTKNLVGVKDDDTARSESMDGVPFVNEVCEKLGLGWLQWQTETPPKWQHNLRLIVDDAKQRGYAWRPVPSATKKTDRTTNKKSNASPTEP